MRIYVACETVGELMMYLSPVRLTMTLLTLGNFTMMLVTCGTMEIRVLGMVGLEVLVKPAVAGTADPVIHIFRILQYMLCTVGTVANQAVLICLTLYMRLMAVKACWLHAMLGSIYACNMTANASHCSIMLAGIFFHLPAFRIVMAYLTGHNLLAVLIPDLLLHAFKRDIQRRMGILVTLQAVRESIAVLQAMTPGTFGHYFLVIVFGGYVGVELGMTLQAVKPVLTVAVLQPCVLTTVT